MRTDGSDGGPAFPPQHDPHTHYSGMTLRDWFAGQAMVAMGDRRWDADTNNNLSSTDVASRAAYARADAMLAAREATQ